MIPIVAAMFLSGQAIEDLPADCARALTTLEVNACRLRDVGLETDRMERYLAAARTRAQALDASESWAGRTQQVAYLLNSQAVWAAYSNIVCEGVYDHWKEGTVRDAQYLGCKIEMTRERTHVLWRDYLTYVDSTPPVLPEPLDQATEVPAEP